MEDVSFLSFFSVVGLAFLAPLLVSQMPRTRIPCVVSEILAGIVVGQTVFELKRMTMHGLASCLVAILQGDFVANLCTLVRIIVDGIALR